MPDDLPRDDAPDTEDADVVAVASRSRQVRRRRQAVGGGLALAALLAVGIVATRDDDGRHRVSIVDSTPTAPETAPDAVPDTAPDTAPDTGPGTVPDTVPDTVPASGPSSTGPPAFDCSAGTRTYLGHGLSAVLPVGTTIRLGEMTADAGPVHAGVDIVVALDGVELHVARGGVDPGEPATLLERDGAVIRVTGDEGPFMACVSDTVRYDAVLDMLPDPESDAPDAIDLDDRPVVAVDGAGDAVLIAANGAGGAASNVLLHEGWDLDDPPPDEGDVVVVDVVDVTGDGSTAWVGLCCEPVAGSVLEASPPAAATYDQSLGFGHAPTLSPDERYLATIDVAGIMVRDRSAGGEIVGTAAVDETTGVVSELRWTGPRTLVALVISELSTDMVAFELSDGLPAEIARRTIDQAGWVDAARFDLSLAGWAIDDVQQGAELPGDAHVLYLFGHDDDRLLIEAYDPVTLERVPSRDATAPVGATRVSLTPLGGVRWLDGGRRLTVDGAAIPGEYTWVR